MLTKRRNTKKTKAKKPVKKTTSTKKKINSKRAPAKKKTTAKKKKPKATKGRKTTRKKTIAQKPAKKKTTAKKPAGKKVSPKPKPKTIAQKLVKEKPIGKVVHYFGKIKVAVVKFNSPVSIDQRLKFKGGDKEFLQKIKSMEIDKKKVKRARAKQEVGLKVSKKVREGYKVFKVS